MARESLTWMALRINNFEGGAQGWTYSGAPLAGVASSSTQAWAGSRSLAVAVAGSSAGSAKASIAAPAVPAGSTVTFRVQTYTDAAWSGTCYVDSVEW
jgi:hypothetical protein